MSQARHTFNLPLFSMAILSVANSEADTRVIRWQGKAITMLVPCFSFMQSHSCRLLTLMFFFERLQLETEKHLKCYYACSGRRCRLRWRGARLGDRLLVTTRLCFSPDDGNNSHSSEWWQTERGGERKERKANGDGDLLSRSICCHLRQSKQRFGLERE